MRNLIFTHEGWEDYQFWIDQDKKTLKKINKLSVTLDGIRSTAWANQNRWKKTMPAFGRAV